MGLGPSRLSPLVGRAVWPDMLAGSGVVAVLGHDPAWPGPRARRQHHCIPNREARGNEKPRRGGARITDSRARRQPRRPSCLPQQGCRHAEPALERRARPEYRPFRDECSGHAGRNRRELLAISTAVRLIEERVVEADREERDGLTNPGQFDIGVGFADNPWLLIERRGSCVIGDDTDAVRVRLERFERLAGILRTVAGALDRDRLAGDCHVSLDFPHEAGPGESQIDKEL